MIGQARVLSEAWDSYLHVCWIPPQPGRWETALLCCTGGMRGNGKQSTDADLPLRNDLNNILLSSLLFCLQ